MKRLGEWLLLDWKMKWHYFVKGRSLCHKYRKPAEESYHRERDYTDESDENCLTCRIKRNKLERGEE